MKASPYRLPGDDERDQRARGGGRAEYELLPVFALAWLASLSRVRLALREGEVLAAEPVVALLLALVLTLLMARPLWTMLEAASARARRRIKER